MRKQKKLRFLLASSNTLHCYGLHVSHMALCCKKKKIVIWKAVTILYIIDTSQFIMTFSVMYRSTGLLGHDKEDETHVLTALG